jgi:hypothetical protein
MKKTINPFYTFNETNKNNLTMVLDQIPKYLWISHKQKDIYTNEFKSLPNISYTASNFDG